MSSSSTNINLKGKRKKKIAPSANPLFTQWLTEWKQEAAEKGWKSAHTYAKALKTLKAFPLTLASGKDCKLLQNFGEKICKMLDEKLAEHKLNQGKLAANPHGPIADVYNKSNGNCESLPSHHQITSNKSTSWRRNKIDKSENENAVCSLSASTSSHLPAPQRTDTSPPLQVEPSRQTVYSDAASFNAAEKCQIVGLHNISDNSDSDNDIEVISPPHKKKIIAAGNPSRQYVPAYRSGPYALILALFRYMQDAEFKGYLTKSELSHAAQQFSDKSFTVPDAGGRYTAWSSMGTMIKKGFIIKTSSPARYTLTDEGYQLGQQLNSAKMLDDGTVDISCRRSRSADSSHLSGLHTTNNLPGRSRDRRNSETNDQLKFQIAESINHPWQQKSITDSEDDDLSAAITESLLCYSQEEAKKCQSPALFLPTITAGLATQQIHEHASTKYEQPKLCSDSHDDSSSNLSSIINDNNDDDILIVSDDEGAVNNQEPVLPTRSWTHYHSMSPSQSSPPPLTLSSSKSSASIEAVPRISASSAKSVSPDVEQFQRKVCFTANRSPQRVQCSAPVFQQDVMEISDGSDDDTSSNVASQINGAVAIFNNESDDDDDELPDLILPLSKRLVQKGFTETGLLASSRLPQLSLNSDTVADKESGHQGSSSDLTKLKSKSVCSRDPVIASTFPSSTASDTLRHCPISHSSNYEHNSCSAVVDNRQDFNSKDTISAGFQSSVRVTNTVYNNSENSKHPQMRQPVSSSYVPSSAAAETVREHCPAFTLHPGSFDIILCLDNREFYGRGSSKTLLPELMKSGIQCDLRLLHVGDLLWIARERVGHHAERGRELVLHYIIERKRMDDLVSSMTDGRLKEQKFRLKHCGVSEAIILIEEYGSIQNFSISEDRIKQSIVNSQIIDGFKVKHCGSANEAVTYLATMTCFLRQHYSTKILHAVSHDRLKLLKRQQAIENKEHYLLPFDVFNEASVKHKDLTVKEMFAKQLIQVPGVSAERARAITNVYPTFSILMSAYDNCTKDTDRQKLLSGIKCGKKERNLGNAISQILCMLYSQKGSLS